MTRTRAKALKSEWSYAIPEEDIADKPVFLDIAASEDECAAVARRLGILGVDELKAECWVTREQGGRVIHVTGNLNAKIRQACVVTLEPVESEISESFEGWFADPEQTVSFAKARREREQVKSGQEVPILEEWEDPEPTQDGLVDIGELVVQNLALAMPQYPHKDGVTHEITDEDLKTEKSDLRKNPFEGLKRWKERRDSES